LRPGVDASLYHRGAKNPFWYAAHNENLSFWSVYDEAKGSHTTRLCQYRENTSLDVLIASANEALYRGKLAGRNQCMITSLLSQYQMLGI